MKKEALTDAVKHPSHYTAHPSGIECHEITGLLGGNLSNVVKYVWRYDQKGKPIEDLKKALQYLEFEKKDFEKFGCHFFDVRIEEALDKLKKVDKSEKEIFKALIFCLVGRFIKYGEKLELIEKVLKDQIKELENEND